MGLRSGHVDKDCELSRSGVHHATALMRERTGTGRIYASIWFAVDRGKRMRANEGEHNQPYAGFAGAICRQRSPRVPLRLTIRVQDKSTQYRNYHGEGKP